MQQDEHKKLADFLRNDNYQSALDFLAEIEERAKNDSDYWYYHAHLARKMGDLNRAEEYCDKALAISPNFRSAVFELGMIHQVKGDYKKAISFLEEAASAKGGEVYLQKQIDILIQARDSDVIWDQIVKVETIKGFEGFEMSMIERVSFVCAAT